MSWLGKLCPPDCLMKSDIKAPSCAAIFRFGIVALQCVRAGEDFCGLYVAHVRIICPVRDVTHVRKCTRPSPALPYCKRQEAGRGPGNEANNRAFLLLRDVAIRSVGSAIRNVRARAFVYSVNKRGWCVMAHSKQRSSFFLFGALSSM